MRVFWTDGQSEEFKPSQKGVAIPHDRLNDLKDLINSIN
ncbi:MAG TPA: PC4/YdbC family ssDNA-binding protein [Acetivibrio clariflavus]|nr:PC4/YdbC family ssDNA-binding protein [Acetivibrio clariflavus]HOQ00071.1 PC4/YdbC family ssDNA-binding protein [Acetivibrio clariflavus]